MNSKSILKKITVGVLIAMTFTLTACKSGNNKSTSEEVSKKIVNIGVTYSPNNINPLSPVGVVSTYVAEILFQPLLEVDENMKFQPMLADSIETKDNITFTVNLNKNAKWTDGKPVTADDLIFTIKLIGNEKTASNLAFQYNIFEGFNDSGYIPEGITDVAGVKKIDEYTVELKTKKTISSNVFNDSIARYLMTVPKHILKDIAPENINKSPFFLKPDVTNGPFKLVSYNRDNFVELEANKDFFRGTPKIDQLNFKVMKGNEIAARLQSGEIDMNIPSFGVIPVEDFDKVKSLSNITTTLAKPVANEYIYINEKVVPDVRVRQAIVYGVNRAQIVSDLLKGNGEVIDGFFTSYSPYFDKSLKATEYNPEKAKALLKEAGFDTNKVLTVSVMAGDSTLEQAANIFAANLKEVGINVKIQITDLATLVSKLDNKDFDLGILQYSLTPIDPFPDMAYFLQEGNNVSYDNKEVQALINEVRNATDENKINEIYGRINKIASVEVPMPSLYVSRSLGAVNKRLVGVKANDYGTFIDVYKWDVK